MARIPIVRTALLHTVFAWLVLLPGSARAQPHRVCLYLDLGALYWDASPRAADGEDFREEYGRNEGALSYPAQRWLAHVRDEDSGLALFGWEPLDATGCAELELPDETTSLRVEWVRWALWEDEPETGNQIIGYRCPQPETCAFEQLRQTVPPDRVSGMTAVHVSSLQVQPTDAVLWAAAFAEDRFAAMGEQPLHDTRIYLGHDPYGVLPGRTQADRTFGNQPSVIIEGRSWHSKFTVAHEYGHQQTINAANPGFGPDDLDYCYDPTSYPASVADCPHIHTMTSHEWQAAAAIEGIASWYAVSTWNDVDLVECPNCQPGVRYVSPRSATEASTYAVPRTTALCTALGEPQCPPGVGNEWDWLSALRMFRLQAPTTPSFHTMLTMLSATFAAGNWSPRSPDGSFWAAFDQTMALHLGANHPAWQNAAMQMELDR